MDNKEVIKEFKEYVACFVGCCESDRYTHQLLERVLGVIKEQEERIAIMSEGGWTDARTNPPNKHGKYFAFTDNEEIIWVEFNPDYEDGEKWGWQDRQYDMNGCVVDSYWIPCTYRILYWMNIPEPPKEGEA